MVCANEVKRAFASIRAFVAILSNCVDIVFYLCVCRICVFGRNSFCPAASPCTWLSHAPSTTSGSDSHRGVRLPVDGPFSRRTPISKTVMGLPGSVLFPFPSCCALSPRRGLRFPRPLRKSTVAFRIFDSVGPRLYSRGSIASLALRPNVALPTLNPCRYLHRPKARFRVGRLFPFPEQEFHLLKTAGLARRTKYTYDLQGGNNVRYINPAFFQLSFVNCAEKVFNPLVPQS